MGFFSSKKKNPKITFEILDFKDVKIEVDWHGPKNDQESIDLTKALANLMIMLQTGQLSQKINSVILKTGHDNLCDQVAKAVVHLANQNIQRKPATTIKRHLVMQPKDVFNTKST